MKMKLGGLVMGSLIRENRLSRNVARNSGYGDVPYTQIGKDGIEHTHRTPKNFLKFRESVASNPTVNFCGDPFRVHSHFNHNAAGLAFFLFHDKQEKECILVLTFEASRWYPAALGMHTTARDEWFKEYGERIGMHFIRVEPVFIGIGLDQPDPGVLPDWFFTRNTNRSNMNRHGLKLVPYWTRNNNSLKDVWTLGWNH